MTPDKFRDYLSDDSGAGNGNDDSVEPYLPDGHDRIIIQLLRSGEWYALWERGGSSTPVAEFTGDRQEAVEWARARVDDILIYDPTSHDVLPLERP